MNDEIRDIGNDEVHEENDALADAASVVNELQDQVDLLEAQLAEARARILDLESVSSIPTGDDELRSLAATIRAAQRAGHPDAGKHVEHLLHLLLGA